MTHDRPPAAPRRGAQPDRDPLRPAPGYHLSDLGQQMAERVADTIARPRHHPRRRPRRWSGPSRPRSRWPTRSGSTIQHRRAGHRVDEHVRGQDVRRRRRRSSSDPSSWRLPVEPVAAVVGRALQADRRPDDGRRPRRPATPRRATRRSSSPTSCRSGSTRLHVEGRSFLHDPRKRQCTPVLPHLADLRGRPAAHDHLLRAGRRPDPGQGPQGAVLRRWRAATRPRPAAPRGEPSYPAPVAAGAASSRPRRCSPAARVRS